MKDRRTKRKWKVESKKMCKTEIIFSKVKTRQGKQKGKEAAIMDNCTQTEKIWRDLDT